METRLTLPVLKEKVMPQEIELLAKELALYLYKNNSPNQAGVVGDGHRQIAEAILCKRASLLRHWLTCFHNKEIRSFFEYWTGVKLGKTVKATRKAIDNYCGITEPERTAIDEAMEVHYRQKKEKALIKKIKAREYKLPNGKTVNAYNFFCEAAQLGFTKVEHYQSGAARRYRVINPSTSSTLCLKKDEAAVMELILTRNTSLI
jgi:hypothetical protein